MVSFSAVREKYRGYSETIHPLEKETLMTDPIIVPAEITEVEAPKQNFFKKILHQPKQLLVGTGIALALVAGAVWFAVSRLDEEDFEETYPQQELDAEIPADDKTV